VQRQVAAAGSVLDELVRRAQVEPGMFVRCQLPGDGAPDGLVSEVVVLDQFRPGEALQDALDGGRAQPGQARDVVGGAGRPQDDHRAGHVEGAVVEVLQAALHGPSERRTLGRGARIPGPAVERARLIVEHGVQQQAVSPGHGGAVGGDVGRVETEPLGDDPPGGLG
jgi:hypothetical protein